MHTQRPRGRKGRKKVPGGEHGAEENNLDWEITGYVKCS